MSTKERTRTQGQLPIFLNQHLYDQVKFADTKAAWAFSVISVGTGALITKITSLDDSYLREPIPMLSLTVSIILVVLAFKHIIRVMYPRITKGNKEGMLFFEDILLKDKEEYANQALDLEDEKIIKILYEQAHSLSNIASKKFKALRTAIRTTVFAIISVILIFLFI